MRRSFGVALLAGALAVVSISAILPYALSFAAGAMIFVVSHEVIPETHRNGHQTPATLGLMAATREAQQGRFPMPSTLVSAFRGGSAR